MKPSKLCRFLLHYDVDVPSVIVTLFISACFLFEAIGAFWDGCLVISGLAMAATIVVVIMLWPCRSEMRRGSASAIRYHDGEQPVLQVRSDLVNSGQGQTPLAGCLIITNKRVVFVGKGSQIKEIDLDEILGIEARSHLLGIERWIRISATNDRVMLLAVNYPRCLRLFIWSLIANLGLV